MRADVERAMAIRFAAALVACILCIAFVPSGAVAAALVAGLVSLASTRLALGAIMILLFLRVSNPGLAPASSESMFDTVAWLTLLVASTRIWLDAVRLRVSMMQGLPKYTFAYAAIIFPLSLFFSESVTVSVMKSFSFFYGMGAVVLGFVIVRNDGRPVTAWIKGLWLTILVLSLPTLAVPAIGYLRDGQGFQGILNHPQAFAVFLAPVVGWSLIHALTIDGRSKTLVILVLLVSTAFMFLTRGRTGPVALLLGFFLLLLFRPNLWGQALSIFSRALSRPWVLAGLIVGVAVLLLGNLHLAASVQEFIFKGSGADAISEAFGVSRGFIVDQALANFRGSPFAGIGFGVSNSVTHAFTVEIDPFTGLPVGAATEKANLILAVLEETGIVGMAIFAPFLLSLIYRIARTPDLGVAWAAMVALCTNVSEMTFFSFGGIGLYTWLIMAWALSEYVPRTRASAAAAPSPNPLAGRERVPFVPVSNRS